MSGILMLNNKNYTATGNLRLGGGSNKPTFTETLLIDNSAKATSFTFTDDYHDYPLVRIEFTNTSNNRVNNVVVSPDALDAIFQYSQYMTLNEWGNNNYATYSESGSTWTRHQSYFRNEIITAVYGMACDMTVTETELYQATSTSSSSVSVTSTDKLTSYDWLMFVCNSSDNTEIIPSLSILAPVFVGEVGVYQRYNTTSNIAVSIDTEYALSSGMFFRVSGIKFS